MHGPTGPPILLISAQGASGLVKELHAKREAAFVEEAGAKAAMWWNKSGRSNATKIKEASLDKKKRSASTSSA